MKTKNKEELNQRLLEVCLADPVDYELAEELLKHGAEPLGRIVDKWGEYILYTEIVNYHFDIPFRSQEKHKEAVFRITELFLRYGMDISEPAIAYDDDNALHPLSQFIGFNQEPGYRTLKLLLDHGLSAEDVAEDWALEVSDFAHVGGALNDPDVYEEFCEFIPTVMLIASYPHVLNEDEGLKRLIWYDYNDYDLMKFRKWDEFTFEIDSSHCSRHPEVHGSVVTIHEKESGKPVWKFGVSISPEEIAKEKS